MSYQRSDQVRAYIHRRAELGSPLPFGAQALLYEIAAATFDRDSQCKLSQGKLGESIGMSRQRVCSNLRCWGDQWRRDLGLVIEVVSGSQQRIYWTSTCHESGQVDQPQPVRNPDTPCHESGQVGGNEPVTKADTTCHESGHHLSRKRTPPVTKADTARDSQESCKGLSRDSGAREARKPRRSAPLTSAERDAPALLGHIVGQLEVAWGFEPEVNGKRPTILKSLAGLLAGRSLAEARAAYDSLAGVAWDDRGTPYQAQRRDVAWLCSPDGFNWIRGLSTSRRGRPRGTSLHDEALRDAALRGELDVY